jgi:hypothetical protein
MTDTTHGKKIQQEMHLWPGNEFSQQPRSFTVGQHVWVVESTAFTSSDKPIRCAISVDNPHLWQAAYHDKMPRILGAGIIVEYGSLDPRHVIVQWNIPLESIAQESEPATES